MSDRDMDWFGPGPSATDPLRAARQASAAPLPRRFWRDAGIAPAADGFVLTLDGRPARTPAKRPLLVTSRELAAAMAAEWNRQGDVLDPSTMPLTRLIHSAIDGVADRRAEVVDEIARYGGSDLLCYRASDPARLVERESAAWDPVLAWARDALGIRLVLAEGVMFVEQPSASQAAIRAAVDAVADPVALTALATKTSLTGSVLLALAVAHGRLDAAAAWAAAHVGEDFQMEVWGRDEEALERRARRWAEMDAAARAFTMVSTGAGDSGR